MRNAAQWPPSLTLGSPPVLPRVATTGLTRSHSRACPPFFFFGSTFDTIGLDSMNELASAPCARCVESSLIKEEVSFMSSPDPHACDFSHLVSRRLLLSFQSIFYLLSIPFHSVRAVVPRFDISLFAYYCFWLSFRAVFKASKCMYELLFVCSTVQYVKSLPID